MKTSKVLVVSASVLTLACLVGMVVLFKYASTDMAAKACFQVAHGLQLEFQKENQTFAADLAQLKALDPTCTARFQMKAEFASASAFLIKGAWEAKQFTIDENREWKTF